MMLDARSVLWLEGQRVPYRVLAPVPPGRSLPIIRSYQGESTGSHPNSEVKHPWACSVLRWGTTWESQVTYVFEPFGVGAPAIAHVLHPGA